MIYTLASDITDWVGGIGGVIAVIGTPIAIIIAARANAHSKDANRIAQEALDLQKKQGEPELLVEPSLEPNKDTPDDPLKGSIAVTIKNVGTGEARINSISIECQGEAQMRTGRVSGDITDRPKYSTFPFTLQPGRKCQYRFIQYYDRPAMEGGAYNGAL